jgi:hypothetical protein
VIFRSQGASNRANLSGTPDVKYTYGRAGVDLRIALPAKLSLMLGGGYRLVLGAGNQNYLVETAMFLPNAKIAAFDATAAVGYRILPVLEARAGFDLRRYVITPGANMHTVTGGTDQYMSLSVGLAVVLDGATGGAKGSGDDDDEDEKPAKKAGKKKAEQKEDQEDGEKGGDEEQ